MLDNFPLWQCTHLFNSFNVFLTSDYILVESMSLWLKTTKKIKNMSMLCIQIAFWKEVRIIYKYTCAHIYTKKQILSSGWNLSYTFTKSYWTKDRRWHNIRFQVSIFIVMLKDNPWTVAMIGILKSHKHWL